MTQYHKPQTDRCREIMSINNLLTPQRSHHQAPTLVYASNHPTSHTPFERTPREKREPYSDRAQFYIMYLRIGKEKDWNQIEHLFEEVFGQHRAKDGLTAVYYRIRSKWGLPPVNKCSQEMSEEGKGLIREKAGVCEQGFLKRVGFFEWCRSR